MKTTINNLEMLFLLTVNDKQSNKIVCNLKDVERSLDWLKNNHPGKRVTCRVFKNGKFEVILRKDLFDMLLISNTIKL